ncbi:MAG: c-type cytochrome [Cyanomargarita calcarea GSE-NOS-MK-12-04C]|uniref:C-type cytochrome n=1 Tax=Cyanomargarita calcarea GSE-NOS-MK-12-04C TaxID=2839659 RepID=A0A951QU99_9CYAN|nr:c-type cytochrome [Cyanomargarita calcarea GSE-NOS-MK-12-04C]
MKKLSTFVLLIFLILTISITSPANAADIANGAKIFEANCAGCHINGGNILRWGKNLKMNALKKYNMNSQEAIASIVTNGKNNMSAYKDRLTEQEIQDVANYVLDQAEKNWR